LEDRWLALLGVIGPLAAYAFVGVSILSAPWFSWMKNALSDLGHALRRETAVYYNFGLALSGFLIIVYAITALRKHAKYTSLCLAGSAFFLQLVAVFDEIYGRLHGIVSILFFVSLGVAALVYTVEKRSVLGAASFVIGSVAWALYEFDVYEAGVAVPEIISATAVALWIMLSAIRIYKMPPQESK